MELLTSKECMEEEQRVVHQHKAILQTAITAEKEEHKHTLDIRPHILLQLKLQQALIAILNHTIVVDLDLAEEVYTFHQAMEALEAEAGMVAQAMYQTVLETMTVVADGGSGFVWTSDVASSVPSGYSVPTSYYLKNAETVSGNASMPTQDNSSTMTGNTENGYARITWLSF